MPTRFIQEDLTRESNWRAIVLMGRNVASYKFALAEALLRIDKEGSDIIRLEDLAGPYSAALCRHIATANRQITSRSSRFLEACKAHNEGEVSRSELQERTVQLGFANVIDAFHNVSGQQVPIRFFEDVRRPHGGIRLTEDFYHLFETDQVDNLPVEVEARWRLVETAWELGINANLLDVSFDPDSQNLHVLENRTIRRPDVTSCRDALNGYQKGQCFYCATRISTLSGSQELADVDHFHPRVLATFLPGFPADGIWNLVLACRGCNRGEGGMHARLPALSFLEKLERRNNYFIESHHPLRETLMRQTGSSRRRRHDFLATHWNRAREMLIHTWELGD